VKLDSWKSQEGRDRDESSAARLARPIARPLASDACQGEGVGKVLVPESIADGWMDGWMDRSIDRVGVGVVGVGDQSSPPRKAEGSIGGGSEEAARRRSGRWRGYGGARPRSSPRVRYRVWRTSRARVFVFVAPTEKQFCQIFW
jgi:hypothetical protein